MLFTELGLRENTLRSIGEVGYQVPTPIQAQVIPHVLHRRDIFGSAQTGTGKTASFTLPLLDILEMGRARARMPRILILTPTRELAHQVAGSFATYGKYHKFKQVLTIGGESIHEQERKLMQGADVLIATPGRLLDLIDRGKIMMLALEVVVIDEADRMLDMGFIPEIEKIFSYLPARRQTLMFSATVPPEIRKLSHTFLKDFVEISVATPSETAGTVQQYLTHVTIKDKREALRHIIEKEQVKSAIIFCNRKRDISVLCSSLSRHGYNAAPLHGDLHQSVRSDTLDAFKKGKINFLVASDVAGRGLDVEELDFVFNFDVPINAEEYVHRIGRTGRAGRPGRAFMFVTKSEAVALKNIQALINMTIETYPIEKIIKNVKEPLESPVKSDKPNTSRPKRVTKQEHKSSSNIPVVGFGDSPPAFMKNYFPHVGALL
ncbi:MAG: DEAD/DEAH box helicase [Janthinobacterium lividum]